MNCPKTAFFTFSVIVLVSSLCFASVVPASGEFDIVDSISAEALIFDQQPWVSPSMAMTAFLTVYATSDYANVYAGASNICNLTTLVFIDGGHHFIDNDSVSGDLAIRFGNSTPGEITFAPTVATINFAGGPMDVYLPEFSLAKSENMHFWVAADGSTYFANVTGGEGASGAPNMSAKESIDAGHVAAVPEPGTLVLLGAGGLLLFRRRTKS